MLKIVDDRACGAVDQGDDRMKIALMVRVRHIATNARLVQKADDAGLSGRRPDPFCIGGVPGIHGQDQIERMKIAGRELACALP